MSILRAALLFAALTAPSAAPAAQPDRANGEAFAATFADALMPRRPILVEDAAASAAQNYFDYDALLTMGALALAGGALAAWGLRSRGDDAAPVAHGAAHWIQADLQRSLPRPRDAA